VKHARLRTPTETTHFRVLGDAALIDAMRAGLPEAWAEFDARFRPLLERYATRIGIPRWEWSVCITEVLDDEALRLIERARQMPQHLSAYLVGAVRNRHLLSKRAALRRDTRYAVAAAADRAVAMSEHSRRSSDPPRVAEERVTQSSAVRKFAELLSARLTAEERQMLAWVGEGVPHRVIAQWLGISREAAKKRVSRLSQRVRRLAAELSSQLPLDVRREIDRMMERTSVAGWVPHSGESDGG
jgi:DNA-directed RNA polymerase specialized sigma24 family protein